MTRSARLLKLLQVLRHYRRPVSGQTLASELGVSIRTLYRDIATLQAQGAMIEGEPGVGYFMKPGFLLPPLMFSHEELDALVLGMRLVAAHGDRTLAGSALSSLSKISAVLPPDLRRELESSPLLTGAGREITNQKVDIDLLRAVIRREHKLNITYADPSGALTRRIVWPYALVYFDSIRIIMCWCEMRSAYRNFRTDRILSAEEMNYRYPKNKQALLSGWRRSEYISGQSILPETDSMSG